MSQSGDSEDYLGQREGFLTETDHKFLLGEKSYDKAQSERNRRQQIQDRIRGALLDFNLVSDQLDEHDRELIFQGIDGSSAKRLHDDLYEAPVHSFIQLARSSASTGGRRWNSLTASTRW